MKISKWYKRYRVVRDDWSGHEVQCWRLWFPIWLQAGGTNTFGTLEAAERHAYVHSIKRKVVKYL